MCLRHWWVKRFFDFQCILFGRGHAFIQGCQELCLLLLLAVGVFLAGVFEGVGGRGLDSSCCLRLNGGQEAKPAQQCPPPGSRGRYSHSWPWAHTTPLPPIPNCLSHCLVSVLVYRRLVLAFSSLRSAHTDRERLFPQIKRQMFSLV